MGLGSAPPGGKPRRFVEAFDVVANDPHLSLMFEEAAQVLHCNCYAAEVATGSAGRHVLVDADFLKDINKISVVDGVDGDLSYALHSHRSGFLRIHKPGGRYGHAP